MLYAGGKFYIHFHTDLEGHWLLRKLGKKGGGWIVIVPSKKKKRARRPSLEFLSKSDEKKFSEGAEVSVRVGHMAANLAQIREYRPPPSRRRKSRKQ
jgi:hypothetical protein